MSLIKKISYGLCLILLFVAGILFTIRNDQPATIDFIAFQTPSLSLGLWLLAALGVGVALGLFSSSFSLVRLRVKNRRLAKDQEHQKQELQTLLKEKQ